MSSDDVFIHPTAEVHATASIGRGTSIWNGVQVRARAVLGEQCSLGKDAYVDIDVRIGNRVRVQNTVSIFKGVTLADDVFIGPHVCFTNDLYPRAFNRDWELVETRVERGASIGAGATVVCGVTIGEYALIGVAAVVTRDVPAHALMLGNPAQVRGWVCRCGRPLPAAPESAAREHACAACGATVVLPTPP